MISHESVVWNSFNTITAWGLRPEDVTPMVFPMFHTGGWNVLTIPLFHVGGTLVIAREFDPGQVLSLVERYDANEPIAARIAQETNALSAVPTTVEAWLSIGFIGVLFAFFLLALCVNRGDHHRVLDADVPLRRGSRAYLGGPEEPVESPATEDLTERARATGEQLVQVAFEHR